MATLTFTQSGDNYVSDTITATGNTAIELDLGVGIVAKVIVEQSINGTNWSVIGRGDYDTHFMRTMLGVVAGTKLRVECTKNPTSAHYV